MRVVILASGRSQRLAPFRDKVLLEFMGETLLEWQIKQFLNLGLTNLTVIYGEHNKEMILDKLAHFENSDIQFVEQEDLEAGMAGAVLAFGKANKQDEPILLVSSNDIVSLPGLQKLLDAIQSNPESGHILAKEVTSYFPGGYLSVDKSGRIREIIEKPAPGSEPSNLVNLVYHYHPSSQKLMDSLSNIMTTTIKNNQDLYEQALDKIFKDENSHYFASNYQGHWHTIKYPWQIYDMAKGLFYFRDSYVSPEAEISSDARIVGPVIIEAGVKIEANAYIKGPVYLGKNSFIGVGTLIRDSFLGENCVIGFGTEIARSYLAKSVRTHMNYIGDSVVGENVSFGAGTITGNLRLDEENIAVNIKDAKVDYGKNKLGIITGDNIRVGIGVSFMPGVKIGSDTMIASHLNINCDIPSASFVKGTESAISLDIRPNNKPIPKF